MLKNVWLILPPEDQDPDEDWSPRSVFETWEQAVAEITDGMAPGYHVEHSPAGETVWVVAESGESTIVSVPIEYRG